MLRRASQRRLRIESLESRAMFSASPVVTVTLSGGQLQLQGNNANCEVTASQTGANKYLVTGLAGTTIKYGSAQGTSESVNGVTGGINVNLPGAGGDQIFGLTNANVLGSVNVTMVGPSGVGVGEFTGLAIATGPVTVHGNLNITTGNGGSEVFEAATNVTQDENINMGSGPRLVELDEDDFGAVTIGQDFNINSNGAGATDITVSARDDFNDNAVQSVHPLVAPAAELVVKNNFNINVNSGTLSADLNDTTVGTNLNINCVNGAADIEVAGMIVGQNANITTGAGADFVSLDGLVSRSLNVSLGAGNDELDLTGVVTTVGTNLDGGAGTDTLVYMAGGNSLSHLHITGFEVIS